MLTKENDIDVMWTEHPRFGKYARGEKEVDPTGRQPKEPGAKLDAGKSPVFQGLLDYFPNACVAVANVSRLGAIKYAWKGWQSVPDGFNRYSNALGRHLCQSGIDTSMVDENGDIAGVLHEAEAAWNAFARLELKLTNAVSDK